MMKTGDGNLRSYVQTVEFSGEEDQHSVELYSNKVTIIPSCGGHDHGSSKVKLKNMVDFTWEHRFYLGQLMAVHMSGKYLAYGINNVASGGCKVRVVYNDLEQRALLRGMKGAIQDLSFAHVPNAILACVDYLGNLFVNSIESTPTGLECTLVLQVNAAENASPTSHRVIWCPYIPEDDASDSDEVSKLLVLTRGFKAELWSIGVIPERYRTIDITDPIIKACGAMLEIDQHTGTIVEATFSPDGTALATASLDGEVIFFQVSIHNPHGIPSPPRCLHQWRPHGGRPISCLFFLDDHKNYNPDVQFWRFAVTGCENNSEIKVWSCELWTCLQTITFAPSPRSSKLPSLKAGLDLSAGYLLLSDIFNKVLYILSLTKDNDEAFARVSTISEFLLPYPILSFGIVDAGLRKIRSTSGSLEDLCPTDEEAEEQLVIRMYLVQPKSLQECDIAFKPASQVSGNCPLDALIHDPMDYSEDLPDMGTVNHNGISGDNCEEEISLSAAAEAASNHNAGLNLIPPDAFSSPAKKESNELDSNPGSPELGKVISVSPSLAQAVQALNTSDPPLATSELEEQAPASSGSSPSREVQEILSLTKPDEEAEVEEVKEEADNPDKDWSDIPIVLLKDVNMHTLQENKEFQDVEDGSLSRKKSNAEDVEATWQEATNDINTLVLTNKFDSILAAIEDQRQEMRELRAEVTRLRQETPISTRVESALAKASQQQNTTLEQSLYGQIARQHELFNALETTIKEKIENTFPRIVEETVAPLKLQFRGDAAQLEELLKENLIDTITSTDMKQALASAAANAAKPALDKAFKEAFTNILLPGMEKACQTMFRQVQEAFVRGTHEYLQNIDSIVEKQYQQRIELENEALSTAVREEVQAGLTRGLNALQEETVRTIRDSIRDNLNQQLTEITSARSRATTPAISVPATADAHARVLSLLQRGQLNVAFQKALSASDLSLVVLVCEKTEPARVFSCPVGPGGQGSRCILAQPVILSLVQQLSADLVHRTELKHRWLEEAILNLDPTDPVTREHMGTVLLALENQLAAFLAVYPNHTSARPMKMLGMAARALLSQTPLIVSH